MSTRKRTQEDVIEYIKNHASEEGKLQQSLMDIAEQLGYSNATIHRVLKGLQEEGVIDVQAAETPRQPNTIIFNGPIETSHDIVTQGTDLLNEVEALSSRVQHYIREAQRVIENLRTNAGEQRTSDLENRITDIVDMPDGQHYMMIVRKESDNEPEVMRNVMLENREKQFEAHN